MAKKGQDNKPFRLKIECEGGILEEARDILNAVREFISDILEVIKEFIRDILRSFKKLICLCIDNIRLRIQIDNRQLRKSAGRKKGQGNAPLPLVVPILLIVFALIIIALLLAILVQLSLPLN